MLLGQTRLWVLIIGLCGCVSAASRIDVGQGYEIEPKARCGSHPGVAFGGSSPRCSTIYRGTRRIGTAYWYEVSPSGRYLAFEQFGNIYGYDSKTDTVTFLSARPFGSCLTKWYERLNPPALRCFDVHEQTVREVTFSNGD